MISVTLSLMPYKNGLWCVGKDSIHKIDATCKDSPKVLYIDGKHEKEIVFRGSIQECEDYIKANKP